MTPPPCDLKPRPYYEEGKPLWFLKLDAGLLIPFMVEEEIDATTAAEDEEAGQWIGPFRLPWQSPELPEGHREVLRQAWQIIDRVARNGHFHASMLCHATAARLKQIIEEQGDAPAE